MSNLYNQNIGINYKGILNLDTTINTPLDATLRAVTDGMGTSSLLQLSTEQVGLSRTVNLSAGATTPRLFNVAYTINNSGAQTGTLTGLFLNATETALNGMTHNLLDLQVGGSSKFRIRSNNYIDIYNNTQLTWITYNGYLYHDANNFQMSTATSILFTPATGLVKIGGTTSSFPAIKRNGAQIDFRLADDSGYCGITTASLAINSTLVASAILQADSTTKGFLMPRMTYAQMKAISSPATGLQVYNTDNNTPLVYDGTGYQILGTSVVTATVSAGATTLSCDNGNIFTATLVNGTPTAITLSNARAGSYVVNLKQPAGGSATVTWSTTIVWAGGSAPTLTTTGNYSDIITLIYDGITWRGTATLNFAI